MFFRVTLFNVSICQKGVRCQRKEGGADERFNSDKFSQQIGTIGVRKPKIQTVRNACCEWTRTVRRTAPHVERLSNSSNRFSSLVKLQLYGV
jgi:hypothetical protein